LAVLVLLVDEDHAVLDLDALVGRLRLAAEVVLGGRQVFPAGQVLAVEQHDVAGFVLEIVGGGGRQAGAVGQQGGAGQGQPDSGSTHHRSTSWGKRSRGRPGPCRGRSPAAEGKRYSCTPAAARRQVAAECFRLDTSPTPATIDS